VEENLRMGEQAAVVGATRWSMAQMFDYFPRLKERRDTRAGSLSGGEQQMLAICRSLLGNPRVILIDEPTEGLAPMIVTQVGECIADMRRQGVSVVLVEQKLAIAFKVSTRVCVMGHGRIVFDGAAEDLASSPALLAQWLAV
jgi:branched-chain amino acid transport system ATP-binding protein